jgi:hypothetical protein
LDFPRFAAKYGSSFRHMLGLMHQSVSATVTHAQAANPRTEAQQADIVNFELGLNSAQIADGHAGALDHDGAAGGSLNLSPAGT